MNRSAGQTNLHPDKLILAALLVISIAATPQLLAREQFKIQKSAANTQLRAADATLDHGNPNTADGALSTLTVATSTGTTNKRALVEFDFSALPLVGMKVANMVLFIQTPPATNRTYQAHAVTSFFTEGGVTWNTRFSTATPASKTSWTTAGGGGDYSGTTTATATVATNSVACPAANQTAVDFTITADVQNWYNGGTNFGEEIIDSNETQTPGGTTVFYSKEATDSACAPEVTLTYLQNVSNLAATPGNATVSLKWTNPTPITGATVLEPYQGTLILRRTSVPVDKNSYPADGSDPGLCATVGSGVVVFDDKTNANTFTDNGVCAALANGSTYFYKVFVRDNANNYSTQYSTTTGIMSSAYTAEISATPAATAANQYSSNWVDATYSNDLAAPSLFPDDVIVTGTGTDLLFSVSAATGERLYPPVSLGGAVTSRSPIIDAADAALGKDVIYVGDSNGFVYAVATATGQILWVVNPSTTTGKAFTGGGGVRLTSLLAPPGTPAYDLVVLGTNLGANTTGNQIIGINGSTGAAVWTTTGNTGSISKMDIINSTPLIDYKNSAIWVTSRSAGGTAQPSLWKLNPTTGAVLATANLGDTDSSPTFNDNGSILFVGTNAGIIYAINPATGQPFSANSNFASGDGSVVGYPAVVTSVYPYDTVVFSGATAVHAVNYNYLTNTFSTAWTNPVTILVPSAPVTYTGLGKVYVGGNDGLIHEINLATGVDDFDVTINLDNGYNNEPAFVGNPSLDLSLLRVYVSTNDQRAYSFGFPF